MKIRILGSGNVGQAIGAGCASLGHDVKIGSREPEGDKLKTWVARTGRRASAGTFSDAASFADLAVLATLWGGTENAIRLAGPRNLAGKVVMDVTNPLVFSSNAPPRLERGFTDSGGEQVQRWLPDARVVKAFNTIGSVHMFRPQFPGGPPEMFICGNDPAAKKAVSDLCSAFSLPSVIDMGGIEGARLLEPLAMLWILHGARFGSWNHAFKLLRK